MKLALDPYMLRMTPLTELPGVVADLGYEWIELSPRPDFTPFFLHPRANRDTVRRFKAELDAAGVRIASHLPLYRWAGPDEDERQAAVRYWKRAIQLTVDLDCRVMNSEFITWQSRSTVIWIARFQLRTAAWRSSSSGPDQR